MNVTHFCHADNCMREIAKDVFFCPKCYERLPTELQRRVNAIRMKGKDWREVPTVKWKEAVIEARRWLAIALV